MLYIVATPIGNLEDITLRGLRILKEVDFIICEDTRHSSLLLGHYQISKPLVSFHQHSKLQKIDYVIGELEKGKNAALITDAGTPGIADPGGVLIEKALGSKIEIEAVPGADAATTLLSQSGISTDKYLFSGFLPKKKGRQTTLKMIRNLEMPVVIYESPHRIKKTLDDIQNFIGNRELIVGRELTKKFQEVIRGELSEIKDKIRPQGEFVIIIKNE